MTKLLRSSGSQSLIGLLGVGVAFIAIGLSIAALDKTLVWAIAGAFGVAVVCLVFFVIGCCVLWKYGQGIDKRCKRINQFLTTGYELRFAILNTQWTPETSNAIEAWTNETTEWLKAELPLHIADYVLPDGSIQTINTVQASANPQSAFDLFHLEGRLLGLRNILRDVRQEM